MSKSKGNVIDPLALIDEYGADALRFTLAAMAAQGRDIKLSTAARRGLPQLRHQAVERRALRRDERLRGRVAGLRSEVARRRRSTAGSRARPRKAAREVTEAIEPTASTTRPARSTASSGTSSATGMSSWPSRVLTGPDGAAKDETRATAAWVLDEILKLLHPFMPFITEELWRVTAEPGRSAMACWCSPRGRRTTASTIAEAEAEIGWLIDLVTAIRSVRAEMNIPAATPIPLVLAGASAETKARAGRWAEFAQAPRAPRRHHVRRRAAAGLGAASGARRGRGAAAQGRDRPRRRARAARQGDAKAEADIARVDAKLGNPKFVANAPEEIIEGEREKREEAEARRGKIVEALERLKSAQ